MKLFDSYTNVCFFAILIFQSYDLKLQQSQLTINNSSISSNTTNSNSSSNDTINAVNNAGINNSITNTTSSSLIEQPKVTQIPIYMIAIVAVSVFLFLLQKLFFNGLLTYLIVKSRRVINEEEVSFTPTISSNNILGGNNQDGEDKPLRRNGNNMSKSEKILLKNISKVLIWLDLEVMARLYDPDNNINNKEFVAHKTRASIIKAIIEDIPMITIQSIYLAESYCDAGLNSIIILSLYFNSVCLLYTLSNICATSRKDSESKVYKKEMDRLREYYEENRVAVIAEFYIEDQEEIQISKLKALTTFLGNLKYEITSFNFSTNLISDDSLTYLNEIIEKSCINIRELSLSRCKLQSADITRITFPKYLYKLNLQENKIGDEGLEHIAKYFSTINTQNLLILDLENNSITNFGIQMNDEFLNSLKKSSIMQLSLKKNKIYLNTYLLEIFKAVQLNYIRYFNQKQHYREKEAFSIKISPVESFDRIVSTIFKIDNQSIMKSFDLSLRFTKMSKKTPFRLEAKEFSENKSNMKSMKSMMSKSAHRSNMTNNQFEGRTMPEVIEIKGLQNYDDEQKIILLALHYNANLLKEIPQRESEFIIKGNFFYISNSLQSINLSSNWFSNKAFKMFCEVISTLKNLKELSYNNNFVKKSPLLFEAITSCENLEVLYLKSCSLQQLSSGQTVSTCLQKLTKLKLLNFNYTLLEDQVGNSLAESVKSFAKLEKLSLRNAGLTYVSIDQILLNLSESSSAQSSLFQLNLSGNNLQKVENLGKLIKQLKNLEKLKLSKTNLTDLELKQISYGLKINKSLLILDISQNQIVNVGQITEGLSCNISLDKVDVSSNQIDNSGLISLCVALESNMALSTVSISFNHYRIEGLQSFFKVFENNDSLKNVSFSIPENLQQNELQNLDNLIISGLKKMKGTFKKFEILGKVKKLKQNQFFLKFMKEGAAKIEELILDSMFKQPQIVDMVQGLREIVEIPEGATQQQQLEVMTKLGQHQLKKVIFIKPQEYSSDIQILEALLEEKQHSQFVAVNQRKKQNEMRRLQNQSQVGLMNQSFHEFQI